MLAKEGSPVTKEAIAADLIPESYLLDPVKMLARDVQHYTLLTHDQEMNYGQQMDQGALAQALLDQYGETIVREDIDRFKTHIEEGKQAREDLILANQGLCRSAAGKSTRHGMTMGELISEGNLGLMEAIDNKAWEWERGERFATYVTWRIRQKTRLAPKNEGKTIRIPTQMFFENNQYQKVIDEFRRVHGGKKPTDEQVAQLLGVKEENVNDFIKEKIPVFEQIAVIQPKSFELPIGFDQSGEKSTLEDTLSDEEALIPETVLLDREEQKNITALFSVLDEREKQILLLRQGIGSSDGTSCTLEDIGHMYSLTRERIHQLERRAWKKIQSSPLYSEFKENYDCRFSAKVERVPVKKTKTVQIVPGGKRFTEAEKQEQNKRIYRGIPDEVREFILRDATVLPPNEAKIISLYYQVDAQERQLEFVAIASMLQISREYVGTLFRKAIYRLYGMDSQHALRAYIKKYGAVPEISTDESKRVKTNTLLSLLSVAVDAL